VVAEAQLLMLLFRFSQRDADWQFAGPHITIRLERGKPTFGFPPEPPSIGAMRLNRDGTDYIVLKLIDLSAKTVQANRIAKVPPAIAIRLATALDALARGPWPGDDGWLNAFARWARGPMTVREVWEEPSPEVADMADRMRGVQWTRTGWSFAERRRGGGPPDGVSDA
jgi:hypothetical protein